MKAIIQLLASLAIVTALASCSRYPEIKVEQIEESLVGKSTEDGWLFAPQETRKISILETQTDAKMRSVVADVETTGFLSGRKVSGRLRLHYEWVVDRWMLRRIENLSFR